MSKNIAEECESIINEINTTLKVIICVETYMIICHFTSTFH